jgi:hypothetical protein
VNTSQLLIIILLITNLVATVWFGLNNNAPSNLSQTQQASTHELPETVNSDVRVAIYKEFSSAFNVQDYDALYNMFGPVAKAQLTREKIDSEFKKLVKYFHSVEGGTFTHSELINTQGNTSIYLLYYTVKLPDDSEFGNSGTLKVTVAVQSGEYQIYGIRLNAET